MTMAPVQLARDWPGRGRSGTAAADPHPAIWHMLDVAACAERLIAGHSAFTALTEAQKRAFVVLAALHDVGKISETFRALLQEGRAGRYLHWKLSDVRLTQVLDPFLAKAFGGEIHARAEPYAAVSGHHKGPERSSQFRELHRRRQAIGGPAERAARDWLSLLLDLLPAGTLAGIDQASARRLSRVLSGLTVAADWVASNPEWFPPTQPTVAPSEYLVRARARAVDAKERAGLSTAVVNRATDGRTLTGPIQPASGSRRSVRTERVQCADEAIERLLAGAEAGAACLWVRNAVDDAVNAVDLLRARGCQAHLLHARFALGDRLRHEHALLERFGPGDSDRAEQVLVATQVVEASLDLDFDVMVSDLAPMGALIQRAGRLWRHLDRRPTSRQPVAEPVLTVLSPDPDIVTDPRWLHAVLDRGAHVYNRADQWRTACALFDAGSIRTPDGLRDLIEAVHGLDRPGVPEPLERAEMEGEGAASAEAALAHQNVVQPEEGYLLGTGPSVWSDEKFPTRLGEEQQTLVLACRHGDQLEPWCRADTRERGWVLSEVQCCRWRVPDDLPGQDSPAVVAAKAAWPKGKRDHLILCPVAEDGRITDGLRYDPTRGLTFPATGS